MKNVLARVVLLACFYEKLSLSAKEILTLLINWKIARLKEERICKCFINSRVKRKNEAFRLFVTCCFLGQQPCFL